MDRCHMLSIGGSKYYLGHTALQAAGVITWALLFASAPAQFFTQKTEPLA